MNFDNLLNKREAMNKGIMVSLRTLIINMVISLLIGLFISLYLLRTPMVVIDSSDISPEQGKNTINLRIENKGTTRARDVVLRTVIGQVNDNEIKIVHEEISSPLQLNAGEPANVRIKELDLKEQEAVIYIYINSHDDNIIREFIRKVFGNPYERSKWLVYKPTTDKRRLFYFSRFTNARYKKAILGVMDKLRKMTPAISKDVDELAL